MVTIEHTVRLATELDESHPMAQRLLSLPPKTLNKLLVDAGCEFVGKALPALNEGNEYATLRLADTQEV